MTDSKSCPHCGKQIHKDARFCMFCMHALQDKKDITPDTPAGNGKIVLWSILIVLVTFLVIFGVFVYKLSGQYQKNRNDTKNQTASDSYGSLPEKDGISVTNDATDPKEETLPVTGEQQTDFSDVKTPDYEIPSDEGNGAESTVVDKNPITQPDSPTEPQPTVAVCVHIFEPATCLSPMTCRLCGAQQGEADDTAHSWEAVKTTVYHEEEGHYEEVKVDTVTVTTYYCFFCGYNQEGFASLEAVREHMVVHDHYSTYEYVMSQPDLLADTREDIVPIYEKEWIVDQEAYEETVIQGYVCTTCGKEKDP